MLKEKAIVLCVKSGQGECCVGEECPFLVTCFPEYEKEGKG